MGAATIPRAKKKKAGVGWGGDENDSRTPLWGEKKDDRPIGAVAFGKGIHHH